MLMRRAPGFVFAALLVAATGVAARVSAVRQSAPPTPASQVPSAQAPAQPPAQGSGGRSTTPQGPVTPPGPPVQVPAEKKESVYTTLFNRKNLTEWKIGGAGACADGTCEAGVGGA